MRKLVWILFVNFSLMLMTGLVAWGGEIGPELETILPSLRPQEEISVIVTLSDKADLSLFKIYRDENKFLHRSRIVNVLKNAVADDVGAAQLFNERALCAFGSLGDQAAEIWRPSEAGAHARVPTWNRDG